MEHEKMLIKDVPEAVCQECCTFNNMTQVCNIWGTPDKPYCSWKKEDITKQLLEIEKRKGKTRKGAKKNGA